MTNALKYKAKKIFRVFQILRESFGSYFNLVQWFTLQLTAGIIASNPFKQTHNEP